MIRTHHLLAATSLIAVTLLVVTLRRVPTPFSDSDFYASIARSEQLHGIGIPSVQQPSPLAVDHIPFYGPVFFALVARAFDWFGVSLRAARSVSLLGALLMVAAAALLARSIADAKWRWLWAVTLLLLTTEIRAYATVGTMATLAIGFETMALAVFVRGLQAGRGRYWFGAAAGVLLTLAALTTPRTYPFIAAFFFAGAVLPCMSADARRQARRQLGVALGILVMGVGTWAIVSHGSPVRWARYMAFILLHEDTDVALLPTASREWFFSVGNAATAFIAAACALGFAALFSRSRARTEARAGLAAFTLLTGWASFVLGVATMNVTFMMTTYIALPLFIAVLAMPYESLDVGPRTLAMATGAVLSMQVVLAGVWYARVAATWQARDPDSLYAFVTRHVPATSAVAGPRAPYFFAVERSGARYRSVSPESWADWARWMPDVEPEALAEARRVPITSTGERFLIWRADDEVPAEYACATTHQVAVFEPAPTHLELLGWLGARTWDTGYPKSVLYRLPQGCPTGYDPTHS